jgi:hypothetical protein
MKKFSLIALFALLSMLFFVSCGSDDEDTADTETGDTTADTTADTQSDTDADTTDSGSDTGADTTADTGADTTADTTSDTDADTTDTGADTTDTGADTTADTGSDTGDTSDTGTDTGDTGTDTGDTGADTSDTGTDTGSEGGDNLNTGDTSGNQAQSGATGAPCSDDDDCKGNFGSGDSEQIPVCLTSNDIAFPSPSGYCSYFCDITDSGACDSAGELCYLYSNFNGVCLHKCTKPSDCRVGYRCSNTIHACLPDCANSECKTGVCDPTDKVCLKEKEN